MKHFKPFLALSLCLGVLASTSGCRPNSLADELKGKWVGEPDPTAGVVLGPNVAGDLEPQTDPNTGRIEEFQTDLEAFPVRITLDFHDDAHVTMWMNENEGRIKGSWQLVSNAGDRALLELTDQPPEVDQKKSRSKDDSQAESVPRAVQRRFELKMDASGESFTLQEEGADKRFGRLLFKRVPSAS